MNTIKSHELTDSAVAVLRDLRARGVKLWSDAGRLRYKALQEPLTSADLEALKCHKSEIVAYLTKGMGAERAPREPMASPHCESIPLSFSQRLHWKTHDLSSRRSTRTVASATRIVGRLDVEALHRSFAETVRRHSALRTRIVVRNGVPLQEFPESNAPSIQVFDLTAVSEPSLALEVDQSIEKLALERIDVQTAPLLGARVLRIREEEHILIVAMEHLIGDAVSVNILLSELFLAYRQAVKGGIFAWEDVPLQFSEHVLQQLERRDRSFPHRIAAWDTRFREQRRLRFPEASGLPAHRSGWGTLRFQMDGQLTDRLHDWSRRMCTTIVMTTLVAYVALVLRWCNVWETVVLYQTDGRVSPGTENALGYFASVLFLPIKATPAFTFLNMMEEMIRQYCMAHDDADLYPIHTSISEHECAHNTCFNWRPKAATPEISGLDAPKNAITVSRIPIEHSILEGVIVDVEPEMALVETDVGIDILLGFARSKVSDETMARFGHNFITFLRALLDDPGQHLSGLRLL